LLQNLFATGKGEVVPVLN